MNFLSKKKSTLSSAFIIVCLLGVAATVQLRYDEIMHPHIIFTTETRHILPAQIVKNFSFGFRAILADLYWVKAVQDFSIWDGTDPFYLQEYRNIAALDPKFSYPYLLGILTFTSRSVNDKQGTLSTLETLEPTIQIGIENLPNNWEIPFYMGTGFQLTKNPEKALKYLALAASHEEAPELIHTVYTSYLKNILMGKHADGKNISNDLISAIYETTESETTKKMLEDSIKVANLTEALEGITKAFHSKYGYYPSSLNELASHNMLKVTDLLTKEFRITINQNTGKVTVTPRKTTAR